jgi:hypothetical protein
MSDELARSTCRKAVLSPADADTGGKWGITIQKKILNTPHREYSGSKYVHKKRMAGLMTQ